MIAWQKVNEVKFPLLLRVQLHAHLSCNIIRSFLLEQWRLDIERHVVYKSLSNLCIHRGVTNRMLFNITSNLSTCPYNIKGMVP